MNDSTACELTRLKDTLYGEKARAKVGRHLVGNGRFKSILALALTGLGLALSASAVFASSCEGEIYSWLLAQDGQVYVIATDVYAYDWSNGQWLPAEFAGEAEVLALKQAAWAEPADLPLTACTDGNDICYKIEDDAEHQVLVSDDGGESWAAAWAPPAGRLEFARQYPSHNCSGVQQMGPYDILVVGSGAEHYVFAALGGEGVLTRSPDGAWQRQAVGAAAPTPWSTTDMQIALGAVGREWFGAVLLSLSILVVLSYLCLPQTFWPGWWWAIFSAVGLLPYLLLLLSFFPYTLTVAEARYFVPFMLAWAAGVGLPLAWNWLLFLGDAPRRGWAWLAYVGWLGGGLLPVGIVYVVFWRWVSGVIDTYATAQALVVQEIALVVAIAFALSLFSAWRARQPRPRAG